jgi:hypothetical protein
MLDTFRRFLWRRAGLASAVLRQRRFRPVVRSLEDRLTPSVLTVTSLGDTGIPGDGSLRGEVAAASPGDTIVFDDSLVGQTIRLNSTLRINTDLTITGPGPDALAVSGNNQDVFTTNAPNLLVISGLTITHGGAGVFNSGNLELDDDLITHNSDGTGAGVFNYNGGTMTLNDCVISNNTAGNAGGVQNQGVLVTLNNCQIVNNTANGFGGGISNLLGGVLMNINNCLIANNSTMVYDGAGIYNQGTITLTASTLTENNANHYGGAIINQDGGILNVVRSTLDNNTAGIGGGGIFNTSSDLNISDSTIANNTALGTDAPTASNVTGGGGIDATAFAHVTIANSTIAGNSTGWAGGGVALTRPAFGSFISLFDNIVANNSAGDHGPDAAGAMTSQGHNLIGQTDGSTGWIASDLTGTSGSPLDPVLGPLQDNGGPTLTMAVLPGSPAVDAGDNTNAPDTDQRSLPRIVGGVIDIGAFEAQIGDVTQFAFITPSSVNSGDFFDLTVIAEDAYGHTVTGYAGTITFSSTDPDSGVVLPQDYTFQPGDNGVATFIGQTSLVTPGDQTIFVTDNNGVMSSVTITVM